MDKNTAIKKLNQIDDQLPSSMSVVKENVITTNQSHSTKEHNENLFLTLEKSLTPRQLKAIKSIGHSIGVGLSLDDAILRSMLPKEELDNMILYVPVIKDYFRLQQVEYKYKLLNIVSSQAVEKADSKVASWLLEKQFSEEFDTSLKKEIAKHDRGSEEDAFDMAIAFIRRSNTTASPVNVQIGEAKQHEQVKIYEIDGLVKEEDQ